MRWPAEFEPQSGVLLAWPHAQTDWGDDLDEVIPAYQSLVENIAQYEPVVVICSDKHIQQHAEECLSDRTPHPIWFVQAPYNDTWLRDTGPIIMEDNDSFRVLDFVFNAWGNKYAADQDSQLAVRLHQTGLFRHALYQSSDFALEGGAIETDGHGTLLATLHCLQARHPTLNREGLEAILTQDLRINRFLWLESGALDGDDTDAHIDTLARFASPTSIVYQGCDDEHDSHHATLQQMQHELEMFRTADNGIYTLHRLPWPKPIIENNRRLAASYANFLIVNNGIIMPAYGDPADAQAAQVLQQAFPNRTITPTPARPFIRQNGSVHCLTMQLPEGALKI